MVYRTQILVNWLHKLTGFDLLQNVDAVLANCILRKLLATNLSAEIPQDSSVIVMAESLMIVLVDANLTPGAWASTWTTTATSANRLPLIPKTTCST